MVIRNAKPSDYEPLARLYTSFFKVHTIFQRSTSAIVRYLKKQKDQLLVYDERGIQGALFLVLLEKGPQHWRWKFRHVAFTNQKAAASLLKEAERRVRQASPTAKIELTITEHELGRDFYRQHGYQPEGKLSNHYRWGETCYVLGKSLA